MLITLYTRMLAESQRLETEINTLHSHLMEFPNGDFFCTRNGKYCKWYSTDGKTQTYIPKKNRQLAEKLAAKKYLSLLLTDLSREKNAIDYYLRHHNKDIPRSEQLLTDMPEYRELVVPFFKPLSDELLEWAGAPYERNPKYPEQLTHKTASGRLVRSKSEAIIDMFLHINRIPFRYECALHLEDSLLFPDFTIRHPATGELFYWEHFGLMDEPAYFKNVYSKLQIYTSHGIVPSIRLITTYETRETPLSTEMVEKIVAHYFL